MTNLYRHLHSAKIRGEHNATSITPINSSANNSRVVSTIIGNGTSSTFPDANRQSPASLMLYGTFLIFFVLVPVAIEMYNYMTGRRLYMITLAQNVHSGSIDSSKARREELNTSRLKMLLERNSTILMETNYLSEDGTLIDAIFPKGLKQVEAAICENTERKDGAETDASTIVADSSVSRHTLSIPECAICMESYNLGDSIVWSSNPDCHHVFHTPCIYEWLRREIEAQWKCPYCRQPFALSSDKTMITESISMASTI